MQPAHLLHAVGMPKPLHLARDVAVHLGEAVLAPIAIFYVVLVAGGLHVALLAALGWALLAMLVRIVRNGKPPTLLVVATSLALLRVGLSAMSGSAVVYFIQPTITTYLFGAALLVSLRLKQPLIQRLANDFCPLPPEVVSSAPLRRFFQRLSLLWAAVLLMNSSMTLGLLLTVNTTVSVPLALFASAPLFLLGLLASWKWFRSSLRSGGYVLAWGQTTP